jgi:hypothetical protein
MRRSARALPLVSLLAFACGSSPAKPFDARYPARREGCDVKLFHDTPTMPTDNLGTVSARCDESVTDADCLRQLRDEGCKLGADVLWGIPDKPTLDNGKHVYFARAAHTKAAAAPK